MRVEITTDIESLRPLAETWASEPHEMFGLDVDVDVIVERAKAWAENTESEVISLWYEDKPVGLMAVFCGPSFLGNQKVAMEQHWYVVPGKRRFGIKMLDVAVQWAKDRGCSHLLMGASMIGGDMEKVARFYKRIGFVKFSESYIMEIG